MMLALALALTAVSGPASAQFGPEAELMAVYAQLQSEDQAARLEGVRAIERNPGNFPPVLLLAIVPTLMEMNRSEDALRWKYFAQIRVLTDVRLMMQNNPEYRGATNESNEQAVQALLGQIPDTVQVAAERRRRLFNEAQRLDERTPRAYAFGFPYATTPAPWPAREAINRARSSAVASVRASLEREIAEMEALRMIDTEIAEHGVSREAQQFIPEAWRERVRATRSLRMDDFCEAPLFVPTPAGASPAAFIVGCSDAATFPLSRRENQEDRLRWLADDSLDLIVELRTPRPFWNGHIAARGGAAQALFQSTDGEELSLIFLNVDGGVSVMTTPGGHAMIRSLSPSGRYALRYSSRDPEVLDLETNTVVYRREMPTAEQRAAGQRPMRFAFLAELENGQLLAVGYESSPSEDVGEMLAVDVRTGRVQRFPVESTMPYVMPMPWGADQALVTLRPPEPATPPASVENYRTVEEFEAAQARAQRSRTPVDPGAQIAAIIDLATMRQVWTGPISEAPPPRRGYQCGGYNRYGRLAFGVENTSDVAVEVTTRAGPFALKPGPRGAPLRCAISADGENLVIVAPPFVHHYAVAAN